MIEAILTIVGTALIGALGWTFQLGTRVAILETKEPDLKALIEEKFKGVNFRLDNIEETLQNGFHGE